MIEVRDLTKRYGSKVAVDGLSFVVRPGHVTGFLGPNGSGKSTTMRVVLGLDAPTSGQATIAGQRYQNLVAPLRAVGALLDARAFHPGRRAVDHLLALAQSNAMPRRRVDEVLDLVGLTEVAGQRAGGFSLGMGQRLGIAAALLGDPEVLLLDEPVNGLDTDGIRWIRDLMKGLAAEGRTVLVSSHLMSEVEMTADRLIVIGRGRLIADGAVDELIEAGSHAVSVVRSSSVAALRAVLERSGATVELDPGGGWRVSGITTAAIGDAALAQGIAIHELRPVRSSLEDVYQQLTTDTVEFEGACR